MKKFFFILLIILVAGCTNNSKKVTEEKKEEEKPVEVSEKLGEYDLTINLIHWSECSHCKEEIEWLKQIDEKYTNIYVNYFEITEYDELDSKVREFFEIEGTSVPLTIIGNDYYLGYSKSSNAKFMQSIEKYTSFKSCDVVDAIYFDKDYNACFDINFNG